MGQYRRVVAYQGNRQIENPHHAFGLIALGVSDGFSTVTDELVQEVTPNRVPIANAGLDQTVSTGTKVYLNGDSSTDPDDDELTFQWVLSSYPVGGETTLYHVPNLTPSYDDDPERLFYPHSTGEYEAQLIVSDGESSSIADTIKIQAEFVNHAPAAGILLFSNIADVITLSGASSYDVDGDSLTYSWRLSKKSDHSNAHIAPNDQASISFEIDLPGEYEAELIVSDGIVDSRLRRWSISNSPPSANPVNFIINQPDENSPYLGTLMNLSGYHSAEYPIDINIAGKSVCSNGNNFYVNNLFMDYGDNIFGGYLIHHLFNGADNPLEVTDYLGSIESKFYTPFSVDLRNDCGLAPLKTHFGISVIDTDTKELQIDYDGDGVVDDVFTDFRKEIDFTYEYPGVYIPTIAAIDEEGNVTKHFVYIVVKDPDLDQKEVEAVWAGFTEAVRNNKADINNYLTDGAVQRFGDMLSTDGVKGTAIVDSWINFQKESIRENYAEYSINVELNGVTRLFIVVFVRTALGSWKIESM